MHANNVLAHVAGLTDVVAGIATLLKPDGIAVIEVPYLFDFLDRLEFDTVYHEHLCYFALTPLVRLFADAGLQVSDVERVQVHGGSLRIFVRRPAASLPRLRSRALLEQERRQGVGDIATYRRFADRVRRLCADVPGFRRLVASEADIRLPPMAPRQKARPSSTIAASGLSCSISSPT